MSRILAIIFTKKMKIEKDKYLHALVCMACAIGVGLVFAWHSVVVAMVAGLIAAMCAAGGKEYGDMLAVGNRWSWGDILADAVGAFVGCGVVYLIWLVVWW